MSNRVETRTISVGGGRELCVEMAGEPHGKPILVHAGSPNSRHLYGEWIADAEKKGIRLISYDRPGYGGSTVDPGHTVASGAQDVRAIAEALRHDRLGIWGISGGGPYALGCAALLSDKAGPGAGGGARAACRGRRACVAPPSGGHARLTARGIFCCAGGGPAAATDASA